MGSAASLPSLPSHRFPFHPSPPWPQSAPGQAAPAPASSPGSGAAAPGILFLLDPSSGDGQGPLPPGEWEIGRGRRGASTWAQPLGLAGVSRACSSIPVCREKHPSTELGVYSPLCTEQPQRSDCPARSRLHCLGNLHFLYILFSRIMVFPAKLLQILISTDCSLYAMNGVKFHGS